MKPCHVFMTRKTFYDLIVIHLNYLYLFLYSLCCLEVPPLEVISSCIDLATSMALFTPLPVIENMCVTYLPYIISAPPVHASATGSDVRVWESEVDRSLMGHVLYGAECVNFK